MVSATHEVMHRLFRDHPDMVGETFRALGFDFPENAEITSVSEDVTEISPAARHVDSVLRVGGQNDPAAFILAFEAQRKPDPDKLYSWPQYTGALRGRHRLEVALVVVCRDRKPRSGRERRSSHAPRWA